MSVFFFVCVLSYGLGSIPFGLILCKFTQGLDIRKIGSGNVGATNVLRSGHPALAVLTLFLDAGKGVLAVWATQLWGEAPEAPALALLAAVMGHLWPVWLRFRGGKGVATLAGGTLVVFPMIAGIAAGVWVGIFLWRRISSLSALCAIGVAQGLAWTIMPISWSQIPFTLASALVIWAHRENIRRLLSHQESRIF